MADVGREKNQLANAGLDEITWRIVIRVFVAKQFVPQIVYISIERDAILRGEIDVQHTTHDTVGMSMNVMGIALLGACQP